MPLWVTTESVRLPWRRRVLRQSLPPLQNVHLHAVSHHHVAGLLVRCARTEPLGIHFYRQLAARHDLAVTLCCAAARASAASARFSAAASRSRCAAMAARAAASVVGNESDRRCMPTTLPQRRRQRALNLQYESIGRAVIPPPVDVTYAAACASRCLPTITHVDTPPGEADRF